MITITINFKYFVWYAIGLAVIILFHVLLNKFRPSKVSHDRRFVRCVHSVVYYTFVMFTGLFFSDTGTGWAAMLIRFFVLFAILLIIIQFFGFIDCQIIDKERFISEAERYRDKAEMYRNEAIKLGYIDKSEDDDDEEDIEEDEEG